MKFLRIYRVLHRAYGPQHWWPADTPFEVIVGAILTQNTNWKNVSRAIENLKEQKLLSVSAMSETPAGVLARAIRPAGYFNIKARRLKHFLSFLEGEFQGSLKRMFRLPPKALRPKLLGVNGIGPETADSILLYAARRPVFVVDAYTRRIFQRLGLLEPDAGYGEIQALFEAHLPRRTFLYNEYHALIVEHAKRFCAPKPRCPSCPLGRGCPSFSLYTAVTNP